MTRALCGLLLAASGCTPVAKEMGTLEKMPGVQGRDGAVSALLWGRSVWDFGDTVLDVNDVNGENWHHNSFAYTSDLDARDGLTGFEQRTDDAGAPVYFLAPTDDEWAFNHAHLGDSCAEPPCGARWAVWPGTMVFDEARDRALIFYSLIYAEPGDFNFHGVGNSVAVWSAFDALPARPVVAPDAGHPTLLFGEDDPPWGTGATVVDAGGVGQPPAGRLEVEAELGDGGQGPTHHPGGHTPARQLGQVGKLRQLAEHDPHRLGVLLGVGPGPGADPGRDAHRLVAADDARAVETIVADPTTRVPS